MQTQLAHTGAAIPAGRRAEVTVNIKHAPKPAVSHSRRLWASAGAAGLAEALTMPVDYAKVRLQLQHTNAAGGSSVHYTGMRDCISRTVRSEGPVALFKGLGPALGRQMGYTGLSFLLYEPIRNSISPSGIILLDPDACVRALSCLVLLRLLCTIHDDLSLNLAGRDASYVNRLLAGGTAGGLGISVLNPMEVIKTQIQSSSEKTSAAKVFTRIWRSSGIAGFWAGIVPNIARTFLVCAAELGTYDEVKTHLVKTKILSDGPLAHLTASAAAGLASASISTPVVGSSTLLCFF